MAASQLSELLLAFFCISRTTSSFFVLVFTWCLTFSVKSPLLNDADRDNLIIDRGPKLPVAEDILNRDSEVGCTVQVCSDPSPSGAYTFLSSSKRTRGRPWAYRFSSVAVHTHLLIWTLSCQFHSQQIQLKGALRNLSIYWLTAVIMGCLPHLATVIKTHPFTCDNILCEIILVRQTTWFVLILSMQ